MKSVLITGAATGIGLEMADIFANSGWQVFTAILPDLPVDELTSRHPSIKVLRIDIADEQMCQQGASAIAEELGSKGLDLLINNAGVGSPGQGLLESLDINETKALFEINVFGTMNITKAMLPALTMNGDAGIINIASGVVRVPLPTSISYNMSKYAVEGLSNTLRYELSKLGVKVTSIEPGAVRTPLTMQDTAAKFEEYWSAQDSEIRKKYEYWVRPMNDKFSQSVDTANEPHDIAQQIFDLTKKQKWRSTYAFGKEIALVPLIQKLLPESLFEYMIKKTFM